MFWASRDYAVRAPDWDGLLRGMSYSPSHLFTQEEHDNVQPERLDADMKQLAQYTAHVRTYTVSEGMDRVPAAARRYGITVSLGIWISNDLVKNEQEVDHAIRVALDNRRAIDRVFVGNEAILRGDVTVAQLNAYIVKVRNALPNRIKVTTAEPWSVWMQHPELARHLDILAVHLLPYWEGVGVNEALAFVSDRYNVVHARFPNKPLIIGEVGWPSEGRTRRAAEASVADQAYFVRSFITLAAQKGYDYYIIEAFDQPWKETSEGAVGAYWGMLNASGAPKFAFTGMLRSFPEWRSYAFAGAVLTLLIGLGVLGRMPRVRATGYMVMGGLVALVTTGVLMLVDSGSFEYLAFSDMAFYLALVPLVLLAGTVILTEGAELALSLWREDRRFMPTLVSSREARVSIHLPCYNEPPDMVIETLNALARLSYSNYEVIVLDNSTPDPETWAPVAEHCAKLGPHFRFFHLDNVKGFKAGALNEALALTDPEAEFVAVIDSDYQVSSRWLSKAMLYFSRPEIALVQAPQDYRDRRESLFKQMCYQEYRGFFRIGMVERNEQDAIIQHGTMMLVRKNALIEVGAWSTWSICEDTELGLKLYERGYSAAYIPQSLCRGVMPDTIAAYMVQRHRWVYGAMQIMKHHIHAILWGGTRLTRAQRYQFLAGWLPWISDGLALIVTIFALFWTVMMTTWPKYFDVPMEALSAAALALFGVKTLKTFLLYPPKVGSGMKGALHASIAGLALTHTVGKAVLMGLFTSNQPFLRTPKLENQAAFHQVLRVAWQEITLFSLCLLAFIATGTARGASDPAAMLWMVMLTVQALPYAATITTAAMSAIATTTPERSVIEPPEPVLPSARQEQAA